MDGPNVSTKPRTHVVLRVNCLAPARVPSKTRNCCWAPSQMATAAKQNRGGAKQKLRASSSCRFIIVCHLTTLVGAKAVNSGCSSRRRQGTASARPPNPGFAELWPHCPSCAPNSNGMARHATNHGGARKPGRDHIYANQSELHLGQTNFV